MNSDKLVEWSIKKNENVKKLLSMGYNIKNGHIKFYEYVMKNINNRNKNFLDIEEGMKSLKIINSIYQSSTSNISFDISKIKDTYLGSKK